LSPKAREENESLEANGKEKERREREKD